MALRAAFDPLASSIVLFALLGGLLTAGPLGCGGSGPPSNGAEGGMDGTTLPTGSTDAGDDTPSTALGDAGSSLDTGADAQVIPTSQDGGGGGGGDAATSDAAPGVGLLHTSGKDVVDGQGTVVQLRGFGLGGWLVPEGYMMGGDTWGATSPTAFRTKVIAKIGQANADQFFAAYVANYVTHDDIAAVKAWGFNSVRLPFNSNDLLPPASQPASPPFTYNEAAFKPIDDLAAWAKELGIYVILDMHCAPGAQNIRGHADAVDGIAHFWEQPAVYFTRAAELWAKLATRYRDNPWVIGYDLLNEPLLPGSVAPDGGTTALGPWTQQNNMPLRMAYQQITDAIRKTGDQKILFAEAGFWALNFKDLTPPWDSNMVYTFHFYPPPTNIGFFTGTDTGPSFNPVFAANVPMWNGETGEMNVSTEPLTTWRTWQPADFATFLLFHKTLNKGHAASWSWWTTKKLKYERLSQPWSCTSPPEYEALRTTWDASTPAVAQAGLMKLADALKTPNCQLLADIVTDLGGVVH
jgi:endoglucanase